MVLLASMGFTSCLVSWKKSSPPNRVVSNTSPSLQRLSCWCGGQEGWRDGEGGSKSVRGQASCLPVREAGPHLWQLLAVPCPDPSAVPKLTQGLALLSGRQKLQSAEGKLRLNPPPSSTPPRLMWWGDERGRGMKYHSTGKAESSALPQPAFEGTGG